MPKLGKETVDKILALIDEGYLDTEIAEKLDVARQTVSKLRRGRGSHGVNSGKKSLLEPKLPDDLWLEVVAVAHLEKKEPSQLLRDLMELHRTVVNGGLSIDQLRQMAKFLETARKAGWRDEDLVSITTKLWNTGAVGLSTETIHSLAGLLEDLRGRKWDPSQFVDYTTKHRYALSWFTSYMHGSISLDDLKGRLSPYAQ